MKKTFFKTKPFFLALKFEIVDAKKPFFLVIKPFVKKLKPFKKTFFFFENQELTAWNSIFTYYHSH